MAKGNFGERLRREREMREVSLEEISGATRIAARYLVALENEEWSKLPGGVFARGFVRSVGRYLGLDEESLLGEYDLARSKEPSPVPHAEPIPPAMPRWVPAAALLLLLIGLVAGAFYGWRFYSARRATKHALAASMTALPSSSAARAESPRPVLSIPASAAPASASPAVSATSLDLSVSTSATIRVRVFADGAPQLDAEMHAGENRHFAAHEEFEVTASDSSAVLLELNGQAMPPIGAPGASGTIKLSRKDLRQAPSGSSQP